MSGRPCPQAQAAIAQIELEALLDRSVRRNDLCRARRLIEIGRVMLQEEVTTARQRRGERPVSDKARPILGEGGVAQHVIDMHMGVDDIADRQPGALPDGSTQCAADAH